MEHGHKAAREGNDCVGFSFILPVQQSSDTACNHLQMLVRGHLSSLPQENQVLHMDLLLEKTFLLAPSLFHKTTGSGKSLRELLQTSVLEKHSSGKPRSSSMQPETLSHACAVIRGKVMARKNEQVNKDGAEKGRLTQQPCKVCGC